MIVKMMQDLGKIEVQIEKVQEMYNNDRRTKRTDEQ